MPRRKAMRIAILTSAEISSIRDAASPQMRLLIELASGTGCLASELLSLRRDHIDLDAGGEVPRP
jgi:integrase